MPRRIEFTTKQRQFFEVGNWALNPNVGRGTGRSTVMAMQALQMALDGMIVHLIDPSIVLSHGANWAVHRNFAAHVAQIAESHFPDSAFVFSPLENTVRYQGPRLPSIPPAVDPEPDPVVFDDDGSEENVIVQP